MDRRHDKGIILYIITALLSFFAVLLVLAIRWTLSGFADPRLEEIIFELTSPLQGTGDNMIPDFFIKNVVPAAAFSVITTAVLYIRKSERSRHLCRLLCIFSAAVIIMSFVFSVVRLDAVDYVIQNSRDSEFIKDNYTDPEKAALKFPSKKRNLIFIWLESMEVTFSDSRSGGVFEEDLIPELSQLAGENEDFSGNSGMLNGALSLPGTTWTMGGMFATMSGLPIKVSVYDNSLNNQDSFFPDITTLGDILQDNGYAQYFMLGSDATFGGRRTFMKDHGDYQIIDHPYAADHGLIPKDYKVYWGFEDEKLFSFSRDYLKEIASHDKPFNFSILTVDTHTPSGYACRLCRDEHDLQYANALSCSSRQVYDFIRWIQKQDFYDNTTIVLQGDHPTMSKPLYDRIPESHVRKTYTCIINPADSVKTDSRERAYSTFDIFPTTLAALGVSVKGDRLALGTNLFSDKKTLTERYGSARESRELKKQSTFLSELEKLDADTEKVIARYKNVRPAARLVKEDGKAIVKASGIDKYNSDIRNLKVKLWYENGSREVHDLYTLEKKKDGTWQAMIQNYNRFKGSRRITYQFLVRRRGDNSLIYMGPEGSFPSV